MVNPGVPPNAVVNLGLGLLALDWVGTKFVFCNWFLIVKFLISFQLFKLFIFANKIEIKFQLLCVVFV